MSVAWEDRSPERLSEREALIFEAFRGDAESDHPLVQALRAERDRNLLLSMAVVGLIAVVLVLALVLIR